MANTKNPKVCTLLSEHFGNIPVHELVTATREFPITTRLDLQAALETGLTGEFQPEKFVGIHVQYGHETITMAHLTVDNDHCALVAPLQYDEMDNGAAQPLRCLKNGLWTCRSKGLPFTVMLSRVNQFGREGGVHLEIAVPPGEAGLLLSQRLLMEIEKKIGQAGSYRGKVLSLEASDNYRGGAKGIKVHKLRSVRREDVILPEKTLALLERNVTQFIAQREKLRAMSLGVKKGLLFYGPPGTGKTHTIHYLASQMKEQTTLLITAEQVGYLDQYMQLARFLQPAMVVLEDVDLIAKARTSMNSPCEESLLNKLLNEMDGLREDAMILFVLTTNRPEQLEAALASRPGRVDQAIEFPMPDDEGRHKLVRLYSGGLQVSEELARFIVHKTKNGSAAFIKELMRRAAQFFIESGENSLTEKHLESALDEMLFSGGTLNAKLLGVNQE